MRCSRFRCLRNSRIQPLSRRSYYFDGVCSRRNTIKVVSGFSRANCTINHDKLNVITQKSVTESLSSDTTTSTPPTIPIIDDKTSSIPVQTPIVSEKIDKRVYSIALSSFLMGTAIGIVVPVMPEFTKIIDMNTAQYGMIISVVGLIRFVTNVPAAWAAERFGRKPTLVFGPIISATGMGVTGMATGYYELIAYRALASAGGSIQQTGSQLYLSDISNPLNRARTQAPSTSAFFVGSAFGPALGGFLLVQLGVQQLFMVVGGCMALAALNNWYQLTETKKKVPITKTSLPVKPTNFITEFKQTAAQWKVIMANPSMKAILLVQSAVWFGSASCFYTLLPLFALNELNLPVSTFGTCLAAVGILTALGTQPGAWLIDKYGRKKIIIPCMLLLSGASVGMSFCNTGTELLICMIFWSLGNAPLTSAPIAFVTDHTLPEHRAQALSLLRSAGDLGLFIGPVLIGSLTYFVGIRYSMDICASVLVMSCLNFGFRAKELFTRKKL